MSKKSLDLPRGEKLWAALCDKSKLPFTFVYGGKSYHGLAGVRNCVHKVFDDGEWLRGEFTALIERKLKVTVKTAFCKEFGQAEYTVWFENTGKSNTKPLCGVYALNTSFSGGKPVLRGCMGDHDQFYSAYENDLLKGDTYFRSEGGRATHIVFPYFDLVCGNGGTLMALGWAGTWDALFSAHDGKTFVRAKTCIRLNTVLLPGEKVRTGLVVMLPYKGRDADGATNLWREWYMKYNLPRDGEGKMLKPFSTSFFAYDTGLPNSDGSISERYFTWKPTLDKLVKENMLTDFRWFDAGWYYDPAGNTVEEDWWGTIGSWEIDRVKWPGDSLRESNDACHDLGMKVFMWFEPERVTHVDDLCRNYGYKEEWGITKERSVVTNNIGDEECLKWTLNRVTKALEESGVDMYREDNNSDPAYSWKWLDRRDAAKYGVRREGINENKCICGHYALWDGIIGYCRTHGKCTYVDSCASGGGRNDIESMRRGFPMMRSDYDRMMSGMRLSQTSTFCKWIPFHGSTTKESDSMVKPTEGRGVDRYVARASYLPIYNISEAFTQNKELDYDLMRGNFNEWKSVRHLLTKDFYALTPWRHSSSTGSWTVFAYDDPDAGESIVLAFRQESAEAERYRIKLPFAEKGKSYSVTDADSGETVLKSGEELLSGITLSIPNKKGSRMLKIIRT